MVTKFRTKQIKMAKKITWNDFHKKVTKVFASEEVERDGSNRAIISTPMGYVTIKYYPRKKYIGIKAVRILGGNQRKKHLRATTIRDINKIDDVFEYYLDFIN